MAAFTLATAQASFDAYAAAELALATGAQEYSVGGRAFKRAQLSEVHNIVVFYQNMVDRLTRDQVNGTAGARVRRVVPLDFV
jgi:Family of unknown function (DUF6148)